MIEPNFITLEDALDAHTRQLGLFGGQAGVRDMGLLSSALGMPQASFGGEYLHATVFEMAGAYLFHIAQNHPFIDGNKRAALAVSLFFLELNGFEITATDAKLIDLVLSVATGESAKAELAIFFKERSRAIRGR